MQQSVPSRKRPAPGASPLVQQPMTPQNAYTYNPMPENPDFNQFDFSNAFNADQTYADQSLADPNAFATSLNSTQAPTYGSNIAPAPSTDLVRRARNQQLAPQNGQEAWNGGNYGTENMNGGTQEEESEQDLDLKVALAKRDAQGKRKQIPPFVQKLSSFLDSSHTNLIRWSDDGRAFIVLDEDEFARTLIPELFKHNNYASFVRQLNMYGFHKTVNITDGSLRQSEKARKGQKPPSMYSHPYFRKNRPDLLWLIQKPTGKSSAKRKRDGTVKGEGFDSDEERYSPGPEGRPQGELGTPGQAGLAQMPRGELASVRQELKKLQQQQNIISRMIGQLKEQNEQFYRQATAFQALHDRHENSINAILTFLATFYNRSLEGHAGQNLVNMFSNQQQPPQQQQSGVVEEYPDAAPDTSNQQAQRFMKRPQLLLGAPNEQQSGNAVTEPNSARQSVSPPNGNSPPLKRDSTSSTAPANATNQTSASPMIKDDAQTPNLLNSVPENDQMMSLINNANATNAGNDSTAAFDFSNLANYPAAGGLTPQQRSNMLSMINQHSGDSSNTNNALMSPTPPIGDHMENIKANQKQIDTLMDLQQAQQERVDQLSNRMTDLSPGGTFQLDEDGNPNLDYSYNPDMATDFMGADGYFDFAGAADATNPDMNFDFGAPAGDGEEMFQTGDDVTGADQDHLQAPNVNAAGTVESLSSEATSPAATQTEGGEDEAGTPNKKRRTS